MFTFKKNAGASNYPITNVDFKLSNEILSAISVRLLLNDVSIFSPESWFLLAFQTVQPDEGNFQLKQCHTSNMHRACASAIEEREHTRLYANTTSIRTQAVSPLKGDCLHKGNVVDTHFKASFPTKILAAQKK